MTLERGTLLHKRYRIVEILGQGGMGSVYRAVDENLGVDIALKENLFTTDEYARQFRLEAVILANLRHSNLPRVSDHFVVGDEGQYLVMDYIEGEDLRQRMERMGIISEDDAVLIGAAMGDALHYLHTRRPPILHRDLKPGNVKITPDGHIFLVDFGLAKVVQGTQATTTGARAMTPGYSPPEQYGTARTDPRTDVYSLGATLYAALSGIIPEDGLARAMDNAQLTPLRKRNAKISKRLAAVIEKAMAIDPAERYQTADDFKRALLATKSKTQHLTGDYIVSPPPPEAEGAPPVEKAEPRPSTPGGPPYPPEDNGDNKPFKPPKKPRPGLGCLLPLFLILALISIITVLWFKVPAFAEKFNGIIVGLNETATPTQVALPTVTKPSPATATETNAPTRTPTLAPARNTATPLITDTPAITFTPSPTPQGGGYGQFAFASDRTGVPQIYLADIALSSTRPLTNIAKGACQPSWSPDGLQIAFTSPCEKYDDSFENSTIYVMNADGSDIEALLNEPARDFDPAWSPDGKRIAFVSVRNGRSQIFMVELATKTITFMTEFSPEVEEVRYPVWSPFGNQLAYVAKRFSVYQIWVMSDSGQGLEQVVRSGQEFWDTHPVWSPDGTMIWFSQRRSEGPFRYYLMNIPLEDRGGGGSRQDFGRLPIQNAHFSSDGLWLIFEGEDEEENHDIFIMLAGDGGNRTRLTTDPGTDFDPAWRPIQYP
jgi:serine/threonine protein kinase/Tol biopolymer transport system component